MDEESDEDEGKAGDYVQLIPKNLRSSLKKVVTEKKIKHKRVRTADPASQGLRRLGTKMMQESNQKMRDTFKDNKVIVFPAA